MAIGPAKLEDAFLQEVDDFENLIDNELSKRKITKGQEISIVRPNNMTHSHFAELKPKYLSAGWSAMVWRNGSSDDQRIVNYIDFTN